MSNVFFLVLRRMRAPLILVITVFSVCVFGLALIPGVDADGNATPPLSLFHAVYVMAYTATTIGFGELPTAFSEAQRMWMVFAILVSVTSWSYALVTLVALLQDPAFRNALRTARLAQRVRNLNEPFYIVCGYGETGALVTRGLDTLGYRVVMIEPNEARLRELMLEDLRTDPTIAVADASSPAVLQRAGLGSPFCRGVIALTEDDDTNIAITVAVRLLSPRLPVMARVRWVHVAEINLTAFGADLVINPFERFASLLASAVATPEHYHLRELLTGLSGSDAPERFRPPHGHWIVCGYGRFGHAVTTQLRRNGMSVTIIDQKHYDEGTVTVQGTGTEPDELREAGIHHSVGIVAGNDRDVKNLAIAVTARTMNPGIFVVTRQNKESNAPLFEAFADDLAMVPSRIVASEFLSVITTPLLAAFLHEMPNRDEQWCAGISARLEAATPGRVPHNWTLKVSPRNAEAVYRDVADGKDVSLAHLLTDPHDRERRIPAVALLVSRAGTMIYRPGPDTLLQVDDEVLFAGPESARRRIELSARNDDILDYVRTGRESNGGTLWRIARRRRLRRHRLRRGSRR
ncbi:Trk K+ transport system, NAD-binding component [Raineyella antarctica]|uniref:Trk K+ transport system, NAD-binding component n=1 Tax=Raineyella antarctica TaxID=1577474 RepID=A0A1G6GFQ4_9ACTN|nr:NAD-binding protein [Raineyella antarctica]SDB80831.1 Trk K+ transport system, NAD-binding component [Raineyella antarctica]